ncbi:MAG TPA: helix-turn-helix domain-containing protein [Mycobacteriales bacterium]|nr:helix-turn-helix domain-containing protein [Mycobacteriales bacterium]
MASVEKPRRRSDRTRGRIVEAAHGLFIARGYTGTTFQDIADASGVAVQTVYFHYGKKSNLLKHVVDVASVGDTEPVALLDRPAFADLRRARDPAVAIRGWTRQSAAILTRVAPVLAVVRAAASSDPEMAAQWAVNSEQRRVAHGEFVSILVGMGALRRGVTRGRATDVTVALLAPELFLVLTGECRWTVGQWRTWTADHLIHDLLARPSG